MKKTVLVMVAVAAILLISVILPGCGSETEELQVQTSEETTGSVVENVGPQVGKTAPGFNYVGTDGENISLNDLRGKVVVLNFWATWCGPCNVEMPLLEKFSQEGRQDVVLLTVNVRESGSTVSEFMSEKGYSFAVLLDTQGQIGSMYQVRAIPTTYFIDSHGVIRNIKIGAFSSDNELQQTLDDVAGQ